MNDLTPFQKELKVGDTVMYKSSFQNKYYVSTVQQLEDNLDPDYVVLTTYLDIDETFLERIRRDRILDPNSPEVIC